MLHPIQFQVRWCVVNLIIFAALQTQSSASQLSSGLESNFSSFFSDVLQKLEEIKESNSASVKRQLSEQSAAIQKLELKQTEIVDSLNKCPSHLVEVEETGVRNEKALQQLSDTVQQFQTKQSKMEQTLNRNALGMRLLLTSSAPNLGKMLLSAVKNNDVQQVLFLLELGANVEHPDDKKNRPIHLAVHYCHPRVLEVLLENRADIESHGEYQKTALHVSGYSNCLEGARILIDKGANLESLDNRRNTPIIHPAKIGFNELVELLLQKGANVNATQESAWTALHFAAQDGPLSTVKLLVKNGANVRLKDQWGKTALDIAIRKQRYLIADFLQKL